MATRELSLFADLDQGRLVQGFLSTLQATLPRFVFGDSIPVSFRPLKSNGNNAANPWSEVDLTGKTVRIAIGNPAGAGSSGTFTLSYGDNTTAAIAHNADGATIQAALNALASITAAGGVVVTRAATGAFRIVFNTAGARTEITADAAAIYPSAGVEIHVSIEGDGSTREIVVARIETLPAAYAELTDEFPVAACDIVEVREGSVSVGAILSLGFSVLPYSGFYTLEMGGEQTLSIPWDADAATVQAALELLTPIGAGMVTVSGDWPSFTLNFDLSLGDVGAMTIDMTGLVVPKGRAGILNTNTAAMIELLNGASQATAKLEVELYDIADSTTWTVLQTDCTVIDDVIGNGPASIPAFPSLLPYLTIGSTAPVNWLSTAIARDSARSWRGIACDDTATNLVAVVNGGQIYTSGNSGVTWVARDSVRDWMAVASSSNGLKLAATVLGGKIYTSADAGATWTNRESDRNWIGIASSSDGSKLVAVANGDQIFTSVDSGATWTARDSARNWTAVASSSDGSKLAAVANGDQIFTSVDSGATWTARDSARFWTSICSSADGTKLAAAVYGGNIYISGDSGATWMARDSERNWQTVRCSSDGSTLIASAELEGVYVSTDYGVTWAKGDSSASNWFGVACSSDGSDVFATIIDGQIQQFELTGPATESPPFFRVSGGFLYIQEAGIWKKTALSAL